MPLPPAAVPPPAVVVLFSVVAMAFPADAVPFPATLVPFLAAVPPLPAAVVPSPAAVGGSSVRGTTSVPSKYSSSCLSSSPSGHRCLSLTREAECHCEHHARPWTEKRGRRLCFWHMRRPKYERCHVKEDGNVGIQPVSTWSCRHGHPYY